MRLIMNCCVQIQLFLQKKMLFYKTQKTSRLCVSSCLPVEGNGKPRRLSLMTWSWHRDFTRGGKLINARVEGIQHKATFAEAIQKRRCLVPATAWFE